MRRSALALLLLLSLASAACTTYKSFDPSKEPLPAIELGSLAGQEIAIDLRDRNDEAIARGELYTGLQDALTRAGIRVVDQSPLQLKVKYTMITGDRKVGAWLGCGRFEAQLVREGKAEGSPFTSEYCNDESMEVWQYRYPRFRAEWNDVRARAYFGLIRVFLNDLEQAVAKGGGRLSAVRAGGA
jgi:hypothetical protein